MITPEPSAAPFVKVTLTSTTLGFTFATTASRSELSVAAVVVGAVVPAVLLFALAKTQPAKPPMTKMTASRSVKPMIAPVRTPLHVADAVGVAPQGSGKGR